MINTTSQLIVSLQRDVCFRAVGREPEDSWEPQLGHSHQFFLTFGLCLQSQIPPGINTYFCDSFSSLLLQGGQTMADILQRKFAGYGSDKGQLS